MRELIFKDFHLEFAVLYLVVVALTFSRHFPWFVAQLSFRFSAQWRRICQEREEEEEGFVE